MAPAKSSRRISRKRPALEVDFTQAKIAKPNGISLLAHPLQADVPAAKSRRNGDPDIVKTKRPARRHFPYIISVRISDLRLLVRKWHGFCSAPSADGPISV